MKIAKKIKRIETETYKMYGIGKLKRKKIRKM